MDIAQTKDLMKTVWHVVLLIVLVIALLMIVTWIGLIKCSAVPGWCTVYEMIVGKPRILIVYGDDGIGNPYELQKILASPKVLGIRAEMMHIDQINAGNMKEYDLVIVEHARTMSTKKIREFVEYAQSISAGTGNGTGFLELSSARLVWTGDAGTNLTSADAPLYEDDLDVNASHTLIGAWARKDGDEAIRLDYLISVEYLGNYCSIKPCSGNTRVGRLSAPSSDHKLVYGLDPSLQLYSCASGCPAKELESYDFAVVEDMGGIGSKRVLNLDYGSKLITSSGTELGNIFPVIVSSGIGERIVYYATPPESFVVSSYSVREPVKSSFFVESMYTGMLR